MDARSVMIHQFQFSSFFLFINHIPVNAAADVKLSATGTVLSVKYFNMKYNITQQARKNMEAFLQSLDVDAVMDNIVLPSDFLDHIIHPVMLITV
jgi:hypothetical protein